MLGGLNIFLFLSTIDNKNKFYYFKKTFSYLKSFLEKIKLKQITLVISWKNIVKIYLKF